MRVSLAIRLSYVQRVNMLSFQEDGWKRTLKGNDWAIWEKQH